MCYSESIEFYIPSKGVPSNDIDIVYADMSRRMNADESKGECKDRSNWRPVLYFLPAAMRKRREFMSP